MKSVKETSPFLVLGRGGYGCVLSLNRTTVGKITYGNEPMYTEFGVESLEEFMNIQSSIFKIDPYEKYFITTRKILQIPFDDIRIRECAKFDKKPPKHYDVFVQTLVSEPPPVEEWDQSQVGHAIEGLYLLHKHGFVHNDVSIDNFGFHNNMPVYIDMDSASRAKPVRVREVRKRFFVDLNETKEFDFKQLQNVFHETQRKRVF